MPGMDTFDTTQSYSGRCASYSSEQRECVMPSSASCIGWAKSYIGKIHHFVP